MACVPLSDAPNEIIVGYIGFCTVAALANAWAAKKCTGRSDKKFHALLCICSVACALMGVTDLATRPREESVTAKQISHQSDHFKDLTRQLIFVR